MRNDDITKLPKWAQSLIAKQEADIAYWQKIAESSMVDGDSPIRMSKGGMEWGNLPIGSTIRWRFPFDKWIEAKLNDEALEIRGGTSLWVRPIVTNLVMLYPSVWEGDPLRDDRPTRRTDNPLGNETP